jgi:hypothetical protein
MIKVFQRNLARFVCTKMKFIGEDTSRDHHGNAEIRAAGLIITLPTNVLRKSENFHFHVAFMPKKSIRKNLRILKLALNCTRQENASQECHLTPQIELYPMCASIVRNASETRLRKAVILGTFHLRG